ncbi:hypothetical protein SAMN05421767_10648 [Granulicatella balaenopterae]|uniref:Phage protein n=1 Tax=Granulicatella balaenopterae TaxID=137733 RepID=A0A1H9INS2_9LACT|nr:hypothetical protein [Granulicatella balaenopterae]SEQ76401.1 hypothetical protein SAMN05421767_10648 [Granulicatella balaenopterae]
MTYNTQNIQVQGAELDWNGTITADSEAKPYLLLDEGFYKFTVTNIEKTRYQPSPTSKIPACPMANVELTIKVLNEKGEPEETKVHERLYLHQTMENRLSGFFGAIGQKKKGQPLQMNWNTVIGSQGVCKINNRKYEGKTFNNVHFMVYQDDVRLDEVKNANVTGNVAQAVQGIQAQPVMMQGQPMQPQQPMAASGMQATQPMTSPTQPMQQTGQVAHPNGAF